MTPVAACRITLAAMSSGAALVALVRPGREVFRRHLVALDVGLAAALTTGAMWSATTLASDRTPAITVAAALCCTTAVAWRRLAPMCAALAALSAVACYQISGHDTQGAFVAAAVLLTCYTVGRLCTSSAAIAVVAGYALLATGAIQVDAGSALPADLLSWLPVAAAPIAAGRFVRHRAALVRELCAARARLQDEQQLVAARGVAEERARVARELHDVVTHGVSVMVIQASAARLIAARDPGAAQSAVRAVVTSGHDALADLRRLAGVRRRRDDDYCGAAIGVAELPQLVQRTRDAGMQVRLELDLAAALPAEFELAAFRIVQEALTNVRKHAPGATVAVTVRSNAHELVVCVVDSGPATSPPGDSGHGLVGMRERVALHGGEIRAEPTGSGGFAVRARLPLAAPPARVEPRASASRPPAARSRWSARVVDATLSAGWLVALEVEAVTSRHRSGALVLNVVIVAALALAGLYRRRAPLAFLATIGALGIALSGGLAAPQRASVVGAYVVVAGGYTVAAYCPIRPAALALAAIVLGDVAVAVAHHAPATTALGGGLLTVLVWTVGRIVRDQRRLVGDLRATNLRLAADRDAREALAITEERVRVARDLQTVIARLVINMIVQARAAADLLDRNHAAAAEALGAVERTGRDALVQLRQLLGVLRSESEPAPRRPSLPASPDAVPDDVVAMPS